MTHLFPDTQTAVESPVAPTAHGAFIPPVNEEPVVVIAEGSRRMVADECWICEGHRVIHRHRAGYLPNGTVLYIVRPSRGFLAGGDHTCPACTQSFEPILAAGPTPCDGSCGEFAMVGATPPFGSPVA